MKQDQWSRLAKSYEKIAEQVADSRLSFGLDDFYASELTSLINDQIIDIGLDAEITLFDIARREDFYKFIEDKFLELNFENKESRLKVVHEVFCLIRDGYYAGAIVLLYGQFEGLLTDFLIDQKLLVLKQSKHKKEYRYLRNHGDYKVDHRTNEKEIKVNGLYIKIEIANKFYFNFGELSIYKIDSEGSSLTDSRNHILHGIDLANFTLERAFILAMWFHKVCAVMLIIKNKN